MSCYIVDKITIDRILTEIAKDEYKWLLYRLKDEEYKECYMKEEDFEFYGQKLWKMNRLNYERRYPKQRNNSTKIEAVYTYERVVFCSKMQFYKTLTCFLYQCCDSDLITETKLYKTMQDIKRSLGEHILHESEEWRKCNWE